MLPDFMQELLFVPFLGKVIQLKVMKYWVYNSNKLRFDAEVAEKFLNGT